MFDDASPSSPKPAANCQSQDWSEAEFPAAWDSVSNSSTDEAHQHSSWRGAHVSVCTPLGNFAALHLHTAGSFHGSHTTLSAC